MITSGKIVQPQKSLWAILWGSPSFTTPSFSSLRGPTRGSCHRVIQKSAGCDAMQCGRHMYDKNAPHQEGCGHSFNWSQAPVFQPSLETWASKKIDSTTGWEKVGLTKGRNTHLLPQWSWKFYICGDLVKTRQEFSKIVMAFCSFAWFCLVFAHWVSVSRSARKSFGLPRVSLRSPRG